MKTQLLGKNIASMDNIFTNRNVSPMLVLNKDGDKALIDPFKMKNMKEAVDLVHKHIQNESTFYIQQDPDADGYTSTALLVQYLERVAGDKIKIIIGIHDDKTHGFDMKHIQSITEKIDIAIAPDAGSNEYLKHSRLKESGIDVLVLDHHEADGYSEDAVVVNPSLDDYPNKSISGVGVVQKFAHAYDIAHGFDYSSDYFDLVAVGKIGDMIPVNTPEAVYMVQRGMQNVKNTFLKALYAKQDYSMKGTVTPMGIAFYITPMINALTRVGTLEEKQMVTVAMTQQEEEDVKSTKRGAQEGDTEKKHEQCVRIMANIKSRQARTVDKAYSLALGKIEKESLLDNKIIILDMEDTVDKGLTGLIANKIMAEYQQPVLLGNPNQDSLKGSGRSYDKSDLADLRGFLNESGIVEFAEGHASAFGFSIEKERVKTLLDYANKELEHISFDPTHKIDFDVDYKDIDLMLLEDITKYAPFWARGIEEPLFRISNMTVNKSEVEITGDFESRTIKIVKPGLTMMKFRLDDSRITPFLENENLTIDVVGRVTMNDYKGTKTLTMFLEDFEVGRIKKFYF